MQLDQLPRRDALPRRVAVQVVTARLGGGHVIEDMSSCSSLAAGYSRCQSPPEQSQETPPSIQWRKRLGIGADRLSHRHARGARRVEHPLDGGDHVGVPGLSQQAHRAGQVHRAGDDAVHARDSQDLLDLVHRVDVLDLQDGQDLGVDLGQVVLGVFAR